MNFGVKSYVCSFFLFWDSTKMTLSGFFKVHIFTGRQRKGEVTIATTSWNVESKWMWQMSIKIKKANLRTKPIYTASSQKTKIKKVQCHLLWKREKRIKGQERGAKIQFIKETLQITSWLSYSGYCSSSQERFELYIPRK